MWSNDRNIELMERNRALYVGKSIMQNQGLATCICYRGAKDIDVQFEDGAISTCPLARFKMGQVSHPSNRKVFRDDYIKSILGNTYTNPAGRTYKVIGGKGSRNIDVQFEDGAIRKDMKASVVFKGLVSHPDERAYSRMRVDAEKRVGEEYYSAIGMKFKIIGYIIKDLKVYYHIVLDDGNEMDVYDGGQFKKGELKHPTISGKVRKVGINFHGFKVIEREYSEGKGGRKYYSCRCEKCGLEDILTFDEMLNHICEV